MTNSITTLSKPSSSADRQISVVARVLRRLVLGYRYVTAGRPSPCRYHPTCSTYALEALEVHGAARGSFLAARRILRCNPWGAHGIDLVPLPKEKVNPE
jgi:putative membrane protein insertion efficiency factor